MMNAGVMYEKAKEPEQAAEVYLDLADKYEKSNAELAEKAAFAAGQTYEKVIYYDRAAKAYELLVDKFPKGSQTPDALYDAAVLRQALGQNDKAIAHYKEYATKFNTRKDAAGRRVQHRRRSTNDAAGDDGNALKVVLVVAAHDVRQVAVGQAG